MCLRDEYHNHKYIADPKTRLGYQKIYKNVSQLALYFFKWIFFTDKFQKELGSVENIKHFKEMSKAQVIETLRISSEYKGDFSGLPGTFRTLNVD